MPSQNRVTPYSQIIASPARGTLMGNRGVLHDNEGRIKHHYRGKRWIICLLSFKGRQRQVMSPGRYTELFFLDEATALAAGHRPCAECMRPRFKEFQARWAQANPEVAGSASPPVTVIDAVLHQERLARSGRNQKRTYQAQAAALPPGTFVSLAPGGPAYLLLADRLLLWQPGGYGPPLERPLDRPVQVLTPASTVRAIAHGFVPQLHASAGAGLTFDR
jgi:hypothetical protein